MENKTVIKSRVPDLIKSKGLSLAEWRRLCMIERLSAGTAERLYRGEEDVLFSTFAVAAKVLGVSDPRDLLEIV